MSKLKTTRWLRTLVKMAVDEGMDVVATGLTGGVHYKLTVRLPDGETRKVITPFSGSDHRGAKNLRALLRRMAREHLPTQERKK